MPFAGPPLVVAENAAWPELFSNGIPKPAKAPPPGALPPCKATLPAGWSIDQWKHFQVTDPAAVMQAAKASMAVHVRAILDFHANVTAARSDSKPPSTRQAPENGRPLYRAAAPGPCSGDSPDRVGSRLAALREGMVMTRRARKSVPARRSAIRKAGAGATGGGAATGARRDGNANAP